MIGCGSMGGGMALLFAEDGVHVSLSDPSEGAMDAVIDKAEKSGYSGKVEKFKGGSDARATMNLHTNNAQTTTLYASPCQHHAYWSSLCPTAALATRSSKA
jgi:3-hydroxyacyl-CoA dehydrogenase